MKNYILATAAVTFATSALVCEEPTQQEQKEEKIILGVTVLKKDIEDAGKLNRLLKVNAANQIALKDLGLFIEKIKKTYNLAGLENLLAQYREKEYALLIPMLENLIEKNTALLKAIAEGNSDDVANWLERGADANARSKSDWTALMLAASKGHEDIAKALLDAGADKNKKGGIKQQTAMDVAAENEQLVQTLKTYRPKPKKATKS